MAKKSSIEKNNRRRKMAKQYAQPARKAEGDRVRQEAANGRAFCCVTETGGVAAQFFQDAHPQPL